MRVESLTSSPLGIPPDSSRPETAIGVVSSQLSLDGALPLGRPAIPSCEISIAPI